jgi:hypothetical protein
MTALSKDCSRVLARAESMRQAISHSPLPKQWELVDLNHMAEAALMLWDQANDIAAREAHSKPILSESISLIFEPLLIWSGRFDLAARLARQRGCLLKEDMSPRLPNWNAFAAEFIALCFQGRYQDEQPWMRQASFDQAYKTYEKLSPYLIKMDAKTTAQIAYGWHILGLPGVSSQLLSNSPDRQESANFFLNSNAPGFWQSAYIMTPWLDALRELK